MIKFGLLSIDQILDEEEFNKLKNQKRMVSEAFNKTKAKKLSFIKKYGLSCLATDFASLLGLGFIRYGDNEEKKGKYGAWWLGEGIVYRLFDKKYHAIQVEGVDEVISYKWPFIKNNGIRPCVKYSDIMDEVNNVVKVDDNLLEVEYGEYPQMLVDDVSFAKLENLYLSGELETTGKVYSTNTPGMRTFIEYIHDGKKYIRVIYDCEFNVGILSNGECTENGDAYWVEVAPVKWLVDVEEDVAVSNYLLAAGVAYGNQLTKEVTFENSHMNNFLQEHFAKEIIPSQPKICKENNKHFTKCTKYA